MITSLEHARKVFGRKAALMGLAVDYRSDDATVRFTFGDKRSKWAMNRRERGDWLLYEYLQFTDGAEWRYRETIPAKMRDRVFDLIRREPEWIAYAKQGGFYA